MDYNNSIPPTEEKNKNRKGLLYAIIGFLALLNGGLGYKLYQSGKENDTQVAKNVQVTKELNTSKELLDEAELLLEKYKQDSIHLANKNKEMGLELINKKNTIAALVAKAKKGELSEADNKKLREEIAALNQKIAELEKAYDELKTVNANLETENNKQKEQIGQQEERNNRLSEENRRQKARLQTSNVRFYAINNPTIDLNGKKENVTDKAGKADKFIIKFTLDENANATADDKIVYVKITGPEGTTYQKPGTEGQTCAGPDGEVKYTYEKPVVYSASRTDVTTEWKPFKELKKGKYTLELFCDGFKIGGSEKELK